MRLEINLASQPYQDLQRFLLRWGLALLAVFLVTGVLVYKAGAAAVTWNQNRQQINALQEKIAEQDSRKAGGESILNRPQNKEVRDRAEFLNSLIARKALSWTEVFMDLERIVPSGLRVTSISPSVTDQHELIVSLNVIAPERVTANELVRRLEQSPHFRKPAIKNEMVRAATGGAAVRNASAGAEEVQFVINAEYVPSYARPPGSDGKRVKKEDQGDKAATEEKAEARKTPPAAKVTRTSPPKAVPGSRAGSPATPRVGVVIRGEKPPAAPQPNAPQEVRRGRR